MLLLLVVVVRVHIFLCWAHTPCPLQCIKHVHEPTPTTAALTTTTNNNNNNNNKDASITSNNEWLCCNIEQDHQHSCSLMYYSIVSTVDDSTALNTLTHTHVM